MSNQYIIEQFNELYEQIQCDSVNQARFEMDASTSIA